MNFNLHSRDNATLDQLLTLGYWERVLGLAHLPNNSNRPTNYTPQEILDLIYLRYSQQDKDDLQFFSTLCKFIVPLAFAFIIFVGLVGNLLVVAITLSAPDLRSTVNLLLVNLAISDISFLVLCVPLTTYHFAADRWNIGDFACRLHHYVLYVSLYSTSYTHVFIAVIRFLHIVCARRMIRLERYTRPTLGAVWLAILLFNIPILLIYKVNELDFYVYCGTGDAESYGLYLIISFFVLSYCLPLSFISLLYLLVARHLRRKQRQSRNREKLQICDLKMPGAEQAQAPERKTTLALVGATVVSETLDGDRDKRRAGIKTATEAVLPWIPEDYQASKSPGLHETQAVVNTGLLSPSRLPPDTSKDEASAVSDGDPKLEATALQNLREKFQFPTPGDVKAGKQSTSQMNRILSLTGETKDCNKELSRITSKTDTSDVRAAGRKAANRKRSSHVTKLCFLVVLVFGLSWLPLQLYLLMAYCGFKPQNKWYQAYRPLCHVLAYSNASVNPIIYHYVSRDFRQSVRRMAAKYRAWWRRQ